MLYTLSADLDKTHADPILYEELEKTWLDILAKVHEFKREADEKHLGLSGFETSPQLFGTTWFAEYHGELRLGERRVLVVLDHVAFAGYNVEATRDGYTIKSGDAIAGFVLKLAPDPVIIKGAQRSVFAPTSRPEKQYVKDDVGNLTRRFAYCVREGEVGPNDKRRPKRKVETVTSKKNAIKSPSRDRIKAAGLAAKVEDRDKWHTENLNVKLFLGYMNYASNGKLGYCLASSPLRVRDNAGKAFANTANHSFWIIDLAMVPTTCVLVNLYAQYPSLNLTARTTHNKLDTSEAHEWISAGTAKNRESFCSDLPYASVVKEINLTLDMIEKNYCWKTLHSVTSAITEWQKVTD